MTGRKLTTLVDFGFVLYTEMGLYSLIKNRYAIPSIFNLDILGMDNISLLHLSFERPVANPLSIIVNDDSNTNIDSLCEDLIKKNYNYIIENGYIKNSIIEFLSVAMRYDTKNIGVSVLVNDECEKSSINHVFPEEYVYTLLEKGRCNKNVLSSFDSYYVKDFEFFKRHDILDISAKTIYVQSLRYNIDRIVNKEDDSEYYNILNNNRVFIINLGNLKNIKEEEEESYNGT